MSEGLPTHFINRVRVIPISNLPHYGSEYLENDSTMPDKHNNV